MNRREMLTGAAALAASAALPAPDVVYSTVPPVLRSFVGVDPGLGRGHITWTVFAVENGKRVVLDSWREPFDTAPLIEAGIITGTVTV